MIKAVLFDFDGVLADSLKKHIEFCWRMNHKYGNMLWVGRKDLPDVSDIAAWKKLIGFPMVRFLENIGFAELSANIIHDNDYLEEFGTGKNPAPLFSYVPQMITHLRSKKMMLGIVSLNKRINIVASLGRVADDFLEILSYDDYSNKADAINFFREYFKCLPEEVVYVGDALKDYRAACEAGVRFIGVQYGWEIIGIESAFKSVDSPEELEQMLFELMEP